MSFRVILQPRAEQDIGNAARWILQESKSPATALRWARGIRAKIDTLKVNPLRCPIDPDSDAYGAEVRMLLFGRRRGKYRVLFTVRGDTVRVLTVRHTAQRTLADEIGQDEVEGDDAGPVH